MTLEDLKRQADCALQNALDWFSDNYPSQWAQEINNLFLIKNSHKRLLVFTNSYIVLWSEYEKLCDSSDDKIISATKIIDDTLKKINLYLYAHTNGVPAAMIWKLGNV